MIVRRVSSPCPIALLRCRSTLPTTASRASRLRCSSTTCLPETKAEIEARLKQALVGVDRGVFGVQTAKKQAIHELIEQLEAQNPLQDPAQHLESVAGAWRLLYTTIAITGARKTKLGLREFIKLGDFTQTIDTAASLAINEVQFKVAGLGTFGGALTITASYAVVSPQRVDITFQEAKLVSPGCI